MRASSQSEVTTLSQARALLRLDGTESGEALEAAFRAALKTSRPDQPGGDAGLFRQVIAARRFLETPPAAAVAPDPDPGAPAPAPVLLITPLQALRGGTAQLSIGDRTRKVRLAKGLRTGDVVTVRPAAGEAGIPTPVLIRGKDGLSIIGDDLYMDWRVSPRVIQDGGRIEIETHAGPRSIWLTPGTETLRVRVSGLGLPPRKGRPQGHMFVSLIVSADAPTPAEMMLAQFARVWTPNSLAA